VLRLRLNAAPPPTNSTEVSCKLTAQGLEKLTLRPDELAATGRTEMAKWSELVKRSGAQVD